MKPRCLPFLLMLLITGAASAQPLTVTPKKVTYERPDPRLDFKATFAMTHPIGIAATAEISQKITKTVCHEKVFDFTIKEEIQELQWLEDVDFKVIFNRSGILALDLSIEGSAAYASGYTKTVIANTSSGERVKPADLFVNLRGLADLVRREQKMEIAAAISSIKRDKEANQPNPAELFRMTSLTVENLDWFSINDKGITFVYDYAFPHVIQALQPEGRFFFTWKRLRPYLKRGSLLVRVAR